MKEIIQTLEMNIPNAQVSADMQGAHLNLKVVSSFFETMGRLQRQRYVKGILKPWIDSGQVHAVCLKVETVGEGSE